jgi:hypothetical protein
MRQKDIGVLPATAQTVKLIASGVGLTARATVAASIKLLLATIQIAYCVFGNDIHYAFKKSMSISQTFDEASAEASMALKTVALLSVAFAGPIRPQWVAKAAVKLGLSRGDESLFRRFANSTQYTWNIYGKPVCAFAAVVAGVVGVGMAYLLLVEAVYRIHKNFLQPIMDHCKPVIIDPKKWADMTSEEQGSCVGALAAATKSVADRALTLFGIFIRRSK